MERIDAMMDTPTESIGEDDEVAAWRRKIEALSSPLPSGLAEPPIRTVSSSSFSSARGPPGPSVARASAAAPTKWRDLPMDEVPAPRPASGGSCLWRVICCRSSREKYATAPREELEEKDAEERDLSYAL